MRATTDCRRVYALGTRGTTETSPPTMEETPMDTGQAGDGPRTRDLELGRLAESSLPHHKTEVQGHLSGGAGTAETVPATPAVRAPYAPMTLDQKAELLSRIAERR